MISVLALVVAALAVFFGPLVTRANTQRQIQVTAREAWMREFREQVAQFIAGTANTDHVTAGTREAGEVHAGGDARATRLVIGELVENVRATQASTSAVRLLIAEKGAQYVEFVEVMNRLHAVALRRLREPDLSERILFERIREVESAAADILRHERAAMAEDPGVWREVWTSLGLDAVAWPAWLRGR